MNSAIVASPLGIDADSQLEEIEGVMDGVEMKATVILAEGIAIIRDRKLYEEAGYASIEEYALERRGWSPGHLRKMLAAAKVIGIIKSVDQNIALPTAELQIRPLVPLLDQPDKLIEAWATAVEHANGKVPTAKIVTDVVRRVPAIPVDSSVKKRGRTRKVLAGVDVASTPPQPIQPAAVEVPKPASESRRRTIARLMREEIAECNGDARAARALLKETVETPFSSERWEFSVHRVVAPMPKGA